MSKNTNKNSGEIPDLSQFIINPLYQDVVDEIIKDSQEYAECEAYKGYTAVDNVIARASDILEGLSGGIVSRLIYYEDTTAFYQQYKHEINQLLYEKVESSLYEIFDRQWDKSDPLALNLNNQNLLAWFAYEEIAYRLIEYLIQD